ncbi:MAG TPA: transcriptional regulator NrdR [Anaerolineales bacterium]|nr:transcriptional regulator NrdR [Anaerolineales bacterium]
MRCPYCQEADTRVIDTFHDAKGSVRRRRACNTCKKRFSTYERAILSTPLLVKSGGVREQFDREKLARGIRIACAKRPVPGSDIDRLVDEVEGSLQMLGVEEVASRVVGDMVMTRLKEIDQVAYIRYAIVYLGLEDLHAVRKEIDRLLDT